MCSLPSRGNTSNSARAEREKRDGKCNKQLTGDDFMKYVKSKKKLGIRFIFRVIQWCGNERKKKNTFNYTPKIFFFNVLEYPRQISILETLNVVKIPYLFREKNDLLHGVGMTKKIVKEQHSIKELIFFILTHVNALFLILKTDKTNQPTNNNITLSSWIERYSLEKICLYVDSLEWPSL